MFLTHVVKSRKSCSTLSTFSHCISNSKKPGLLREPFIWSTQIWQNPWFKKMLLTTELPQQNSRITVQPSSKINNWLSIESPTTCPQVFGTSWIITNQTSCSLLSSWLLTGNSQFVFVEFRQLFNSFRGHLEYQGAKKLRRKQKLPHWTMLSSQEPVVPLDRGSLSTWTSYYGAKILSACLSNIWPTRILDLGTSTAWSL